MHQTSYLGTLDEGKNTPGRSFSMSSSPTSSPAASLFSASDSSSSSSMSPAEQQLPILGKRKLRGSAPRSSQATLVDKKLDIDPNAVPPRLTAVQRSVPAFLNKLYNMIEDPSTNEFIRWSDDGASFIVENHEEFAKTVLPRFYKHNTFASFVRQLNMYDFHKVPHPQQSVLIADSEEQDHWEFSNPYFRRDRSDLFVLVTRKRNRDRENEGTITAQDKASRQLDTLAKDMASTRKYQMALRDELRSLHQDHEMLWKETTTVRERHQRHQEAIEKILLFLNTVYTGDHAQISANKGIEPGNPRDLIIEAATLAGMQVTNGDQALAPELLQLTDKTTQPNHAPPTWTPSSSENNSGSFNNTNITSFSRTLDTATRSAQAISQDIDNLQLNIESLASNLGIDSANYASEQLTAEDDFMMSQPYSSVDALNDSLNGGDAKRRASAADCEKDISEILAASHMTATLSDTASAPVSAMAEAFPTNIPLKDFHLSLTSHAEAFCQASNGPSSTVVGTTSDTNGAFQTITPVYPILHPPPLAARRAMLAPGRVPPPVLSSCINSTLWNDSMNAGVASVTDTAINQAMTTQAPLPSKVKNDSSLQKSEYEYTDQIPMQWK